MSCDPRQIYLYLDGELGPEDAARLLAHVATCPPCRELLRDEQELGFALEDLDDLPTPDGFADATVTKARCDLTHAVSSPRERGRAVVFAAGLAGAAVLLLWPTGLLSVGLAALGPLRCLSKFAIAWAINSFTGALIVGRTLSAHLLSENKVPAVLALLILGLLLAALATLVAQYHKGEVSGRRGPVE